MPEFDKNKLLPSLKSRIWAASIAIVVLVFLGAIFSGYLLLALQAQDSFWAIVPVTLIAPAVVIIGWWLSNEVTESIAKVAIAAQILERGSFNSPLPSTGARETEEILEKLQRYNQGMQRMSAAMEQVARGEINVLMRPGSTTDRFGLAFQKLLEETSAAIKIKTDLDGLQNSLRGINNEIAGAKYGDLTVEAHSTTEGTESVSSVINQLVKNLRDTVARIRKGTGKSENTALNIQKTLDSVFETNTRLSEELSDASVTLKQMPKSAQRLSEKLVDSGTHISRSLTQAAKSVKIIQTNLASVNLIRGQIDDASRRFQRMSEFSQEVGKVVKIVEDLARRTNLIALNASIQANEAGDAGHGFGLVVKELEHLAEKSASANRQFSTMTRVIQSEAKEARSAIDETSREAAAISKFALETLEALHELQKNINQLSETHENLLASAQKQSQDSTVVSKAFLENTAETQKAILTMKNVTAALDKITKVSQEMASGVAAFKIPEKETKVPYLGGSLKKLDSELVN
ncbi:MAG TPA: methyl-accepting chemotaxis protein [Pyrinomonadaceae bacterium]|jgi:twitching motility protein PilJ|nr:methyl-accepting chemotaxis protein [Pyrinomonadaceae bacterium]